MLLILLTALLFVTALLLAIIEQVRQNDGSIENAAIALKIIEENEWLVGAQYWQKNRWVGWYYDPGIAELELLK